MNLGNLIRKKRKEKGYTQEEVGRIIGTSKNTVSKYERNIISNMGNDKRLALAKLLDIPPVAFIEAIDGINSNLDEITPQEFKLEVASLMHKCPGLTDQERQIFSSILSTIEES